METKVKKEKEVAIAVPLKKELVLEGDPEQQLAFATKAANALMKVVKPKKINGKDYMMFGGWQTLGRFFGSTVGIEWTKPILDEKGAVKGYEARAEVLQHGTRISSAEASCFRAERNWTTKDEFSLKSMAQTRASAKALRNAYGWVAELAGLESTPAEEMSYEQSYDTEPIKATAVPVVHVDDHEAKPKTKDEKKAAIKRLVDSIVLAPLDQTAGAYKDYVFEQTGVSLEEENYDQIIDELTAIKHGEN